MGRRYRVGEFAGLTGVSVRTLHHYDQIGLLRPAAYSDGGHRLYAEEDLLRLQQILTLRYLGFSLARIGELLDRPDFDLVASMRIQRSALRDGISALERIETALGELLDRRLATGVWSWDLVAGASATLQNGLAKQEIRMEAYYTPEQMKQFEEIGQKLAPGEREAIEQAWTGLLREVRASYHLEPSSPEAQALADRWNALNQRTMAHYRAYPELKAAIAKNYRQNRFAQIEGAPRPEDFAFIQRVNEIRGRASS